MAARIDVCASLEHDAEAWAIMINLRYTSGCDYSSDYPPAYVTVAKGTPPEQAVRALIPMLEHDGVFPKLLENVERLQTVYDESAASIGEVIAQVTGPLYREDFRVFLTSAAHSPYDWKAGVLWLPYWSKPGWARGTFAHELLHFQTHHYFHEILDRQLPAGSSYQDVKEALTVILNDIFPLEVLGVPDRGYPAQQALREQLFAHWQAHHDFTALVHYGIAQRRAQS